MIELTGAWNACRTFAARQKTSFYAWRDGLTMSGRAALSLAGAAFIGLCAQVALPLPFTPVPLSLQTFAVAAAAVALGWGWGTLSVSLYIVLAALGMPWLVDGEGGWAVVVGSTCGYMMGFILMSLALSAFARNPERCRWLPTWAVLFLADALLILLPGTAWLWGWLHLNGHATSLAGAVAMGFAPFVVADFFKSCAAAVVIGWLGRRD